MTTDATNDRKPYVKHPIGVSINTLIFGDAIPTEQTLLSEIDHTIMYDSMNNPGLREKNDGQSISVDPSGH